MTSFDPVVKALVGSVIGALSLLGDRPDVAAQLVGDDDSWLAELSDQPCQKSLGGFGIAACLHKNVESITVAIDGPPEPVLHAVDRERDLV